MKNCAKNKLRLWLLAGAMALAGATGWADPLQSGAEAFAKGDYSAAARDFESALSSQGKSAGLYYNLAMAQMKDGRRPEAALNLRRALMLDPRMVDARMALSEIERSQGVPAIKPGWRELIAEKAPLKTLIIGGTVMTWLGAFLLLFGVFRKGRRLPALISAVIILALGNAVFLAGYLSDPRTTDRNAGVVTNEAGVTLLSAPADQSEMVAKLPAAAFVRILRRSGEWTFCRAAGGQKGWVPTASLQAVIPAA